MKKILLIAVVLIATITVNAQAKKQLSFGLIGVAYEIPLSSAITIAPTAFTNFDLSNLVLGVKANYYFDDLIGLPGEWDVYGGANAGYAFHLNDNNNSDDFGIGLQVGGRWFWSETWGVYLEFGGGNLGGQGGVGLTMVM